MFRISMCSATPFPTFDTRSIGSLAAQSDYKTSLVSRRHLGKMAAELKYSLIVTKASDLALFHTSATFLPLSDAVKKRRLPDSHRDRLRNLSKKLPCSLLQPRGLTWPFFVIKLSYVRHEKLVKCTRPSVYREGLGCQTNP